MSHRYGPVNTCRKLGFTSAYFCGFYLLLAVWNRYFKARREKELEDTFKKDLNDWKRKK